MRLYHDFREKKLLIFLLFSYLLSSLFINADASSSHEKMGSSKINHRPKFEEIYGPVRLKDEVDGLNLPEASPKNSRELIEHLNNTVPKCLKRARKGLRITASTYLKVESSEMANAIFNELQQLYQDNIACDTETMLLASYIMNKPINVKNLYHFLDERIKVVSHSEKTGNRVIPGNHPYHETYRRLLKKFGNICYPNPFTATLGTVLPKVNDKAIIGVSGHVSLVERVSDQAFTFSVWGDYGIYFAGPEENESLMQGFWNSETQRMKPIIKYILLNQG